MDRDARLVQAALNACAGFELETLEQDPGLFRCLFDNQEAYQDLIRSCLSALNDIFAGYPLRELCVDIELLNAQAAGLGVDMSEEP